MDCIADCLSVSVLHQVFETFLLYIFAVVPGSKCTSRGENENERGDMVHGTVLYGKSKLYLLVLLVL